MTAINIREFSHHISKYLKEIKEGSRIVLMERNVPIADIVPHNANVAQVGWKRPIKRIKIKGEPASRTLIKMRRDERL